MSQNFIQFAPKSDGSSYPGVFGWGFDANGYRFVVYGPQEEDSAYIKAKFKGENRAFKKKSFDPKQDKRDEPQNEHLRLSDKVGKRLSKKKVVKTNRTGEHGPAHVHAIHLATGKETRFELFETHDGAHYIEPYYNDKGRLREDLSDTEIVRAKEIITPYTEQFIQLWRELYTDNPLSMYVTRTHNFEGVNAVSRVKPGGWREIVDEYGTVNEEPPPNNGHSYNNDAVKHHR